jgi:hypothetical protein
VWYGDPTVEIYRPGDLIEECGRWSLRDRAADQVMELAGASSEATTQGSVPVLFFELRANRLVEFSVGQVSGYGVDLRDAFPVGPIARLYFAHVHRVPDRGTLEYWVAQHQVGVTLRSIAQAFARSPEFQAMYGSLTNDQFVRLICRSVLGQGADEEGLAYWTEELDSGTIERSQMALILARSRTFLDQFPKIAWRARLPS